jgi:putative N6-adenine-specific DNA methylase
MSSTEFFAVTGRGVEGIAARELTELGAANVRIEKGGIRFEGDLPLLYRANLCLRTVNRVLRPLREFASTGPDMLYSQTRRVRWEDILSTHKTFAVFATQDASDRRPDGPPQRGARPGTGPANSYGRLRGGADRGGGDRGGAAGRFARPGRDGGRPGDRRGPGPSGMTTQFAALKIKDGIVDRLRREHGARPDVDTHNPNIRIHAHFAQGRCQLYLDSSGNSLHERGYRVAQTPATMKEALAAAILLMSGYDGSKPLVDPMCGSGTLAIEAALIAMRIAPGLFRQDFSCHHWPDFDGALWTRVVDEVRSKQLKEPPAPIFASDIHPPVLDAVAANAKSAGILPHIRMSVADASELAPPDGPPGLMILNPPYGERLGTEEALGELYEKLGRHWQSAWSGWDVGFFSGNLALARRIEIPVQEKYALHNGPLSCRLLVFRPDGTPEKPAAAGDTSHASNEAAADDTPPAEPMTMSADEIILDSSEDMHDPVETGGM